MIKMGALVVEVTGAGGVSECPNHVLQALPQDIATAICGTPHWSTTRMLHGAGLWCPASGDDPAPDGVEGRRDVAAEGVGSGLIIRQLREQLQSQPRRRALASVPNAASATDRSNTSRRTEQ